MPSLRIEKTLTGIICGIDEAGCSPFAGPVVAAAVILGKGAPRGINDSKKVTLINREKLFARITENFQYGVGIASVEEIDKINIYQARFLAMERAYAAIGVDCHHALIDGNRGPAKLNCNIQYIIKGDTISLSIAAASIIAKVTRDRIMSGLHEQHPHYNWAKNKGYGTKDHKQAIEKHGITIHHRRSFAPVREALERLAA